ncbi:T9SS type A sorting domain-containing protein [Fibrella arboris]|uniref:T9SS type A sorting domain-containing protein n=1 Tax=Fibrella arboris TaxID=3242486 RepID=UPI003522557A
MTTNFNWATVLSSEPLAVAADGPRGAYVLATNNTIVQLDSKGRERWKQTFTGWPAIRRIATTPAGSLIVAGNFTGQFTIGDSTYRLDNPFQSSTFIAEFDSAHARRWVTYVLTAKGLMSQPVSLAANSSGSILVFGQQANTGIPFLCTFDADGRFLNANTYGAPTIPAPQAVVVAPDSQGEALLAITERTRTGSYGLLVATKEDTLGWHSYIDQALGVNAFRSYDTSPLGLALDKDDNAVVLSNYTLTDKTIGLSIETGQVLLRYAASGQNQWVKTGVSRADSAVAMGVLSDQAGAFVVYGGYNGPYDQSTNEYGPADYISVAGYAPTGALRWSTRLNAPAGADRLIGAARAADGSVLLLGKTTGTLTLGTLSITGTPASPAYYLTQLQPFVLRPAPTSVVLCAGSSAPLSGTYAGYFEQAPVIQLSNAQGDFTAAQSVGTIPIGTVGNLFSVSSFTSTVPLAASVAAGTGYRLRAISPLPSYTGEPISVTVGTAPSIPAVAQSGEELVVSTSSVAGVTYQWYTNSRQPVAGATSPRFRPGGGGAYYVVAMSGGCSSLPSEALNYVITAAEPTTELLTVYPNPATDRVWVRWQTGVAAGRFDLADLTGRLVRQQVKTGEVTELIVSGLPAGMYLLTLQVDGLPTQVRKVLVR